MVRANVKVGEDKKRTFVEVYFEKENGEICYSCLKFQFREIICRHVITIMIHNDMKVLLEKYVLQRRRKDVWRYHSRVKVSYELRSCIDEQKRYKKMCVCFTEVENMVATNVKSSKLILDLIEKVRQYLPKIIQYEGDKRTIITGQGNCSNNMGISTNLVIQ